MLQCHEIFKILKNLTQPPCPLSYTSKLPKQWCRIDAVWSAEIFIFVIV